MVQGYYTLQEAAQVLGMNLDDLKGIAQKNQIRSFQDRGTLRFRIQDVQELQRQRLGNSDPEMVLGDSVSPKPASASPPKSAVGRTPKPQSAPKAPDILDFQLQESIEVGDEALPTGSSAARKASPKPSGAKSAPKTPRQQGSDSDVKLIADDSDNFSIQLGEDLKPNVGDSDVRLGEITTNKKVPGGSSRKSGASRRHGGSPADSGVRLVPMQDDSDIRLGAHDPSATDSDIRLGAAPASPSRTSEAMLHTDEINLDEEIQKLEAAAKKKPLTKFKTEPSKLGKPGSPFELSDGDLDETPKKDGTSDFEIAAAGAKTPKPHRAPKSGAKKSTEFDLLPGGDSDEDFSLQLDDESLDLGSETGARQGSPRSGINLGHPSDKGISLERKDESDDSAFELNLEGGSTPKPQKAAANDSDSEFELSLDDSSAETPALGDSADDSAFELSLDSDSATETDSSGDFELALDDSVEKPAPKAKGQKKPAADDQDLFETDFELPALDADGDSGDSTEDGSSDFELALDDSDLSAEDESGSQVVALDEEDDVAGETKDSDLEEAEVEDGDIEEDEEVEVREKVVVQEVLRDRWIKPAPWGPLPVIFMLPCVIVMVLVGIMGWELVQTSGGFKSSGMLTRSVADMMSIKVK